MEQYINLTNHTINEVTSGQEFPVSGRVARLKTIPVKVDTFGGCPNYRTEFGDLEGLPEAVEGIRYIVSALCLNKVPKHRTDVVAPGNLQRNEHGQPVGCIGFRAQ